MNKIILISATAILILLTTDPKCKLSTMENNYNSMEMGENQKKFKTFNFFTLKPEAPLSRAKNIFPYVMINEIDSGININVHLKQGITGNIFLKKKGDSYSRIVEFYPWASSKTKEIHYYVYFGNGKIVKYGLLFKDSVLTYSVIRFITPEQISTYQFTEKIIESIDDLPLSLSENDIKHFDGSEHYSIKNQKLGNLFLKYYIKNDIETISEAYDLNGYDPFYIDYIPDVDIRRICLENVVSSDNDQ